jgi:U3 small nucleolar RNA-associated protein 5
MATIKAKKTPKPPQGRPMSTALLSQSVAEDISSLFALSSFSPEGYLFSFVPHAIGKHRLRVYNTTTGRAIADHSIDNALISSMAWSALELGEADSSEGSQPSKKKRKKKDSLGTRNVRSKVIEVVILGLTDGSILCFSPSHGRVLRTLSHASSSSPVMALAVEECHGRSLIWASGQDATLRLWDVNKNEIVGSWKNDDRTPYTSLTIRFIDGDERTDILTASHNIRLLSRLKKTEEILPQKLSQVTTFIGHSSPVQSMKWIKSGSILTRFVSMAEMDRFLYVWDIPDSTDIDGKAVASVPLDSEARFVCVSDYTDSSYHPILLTLSASGKIALYPVSHQISSSSSSNRPSAKLPTLHPRSTITSTSKKSSVPAIVINASFVHGEQGKIRVARLVRGIRPVFTITVSTVASMFVFLQLTGFMD